MNGNPTRRRYAGTFGAQPVVDTMIAAYTSLSAPSAPGGSTSALALHPIQPTQTAFTNNLTAGLMIATFPNMTVAASGSVIGSLVLGIDAFTASVLLDVGVTILISDAAGTNRKRLISASLFQIAAGAYAGRSPAAIDYTTLTASGTATDLTVNANSVVSTAGGLYSVTAFLIIQND